jgi:hypothetical protein
MPCWRIRRFIARRARSDRPKNVSDQDIEIYLRPLVRTEQRTRDLQRFVAAFDHKHTVVIESRLRQLRAPTLIVWGTDDVYFPVKWAYWLAETIQGRSRRSSWRVRGFSSPRSARKFSTDSCAITCGPLRLLDLIDATEPRITRDAEEKL